MAAKGKRSHKTILAPVKESWVDRAITTAKYHVEKCKQTSRWTISDTATLLHRSFGSVAEDLTIVSWLKTHPDEIRSFKYAKDAIAFIKEKKRRMIVDISHLE